MAESATPPPAPGGDGVSRAPGGGSASPPSPPSPPSLEDITLDGSDKAGAGKGVDSESGVSVADAGAAPRRPFYKRPWFIAAACAVAAAAIAVPTAVVLSQQKAGAAAQPAQATPSPSGPAPAGGASFTGTPTSAPLATALGIAGAPTTPVVLPPSGTSGYDDNETPYPSHTLPSPSATPRGPPIWRSWYENTSKRPAPPCPVLETPSAQQPSYASFPLPFPAQPDPALQIVVDLNSQYGLDEGNPDNYNAVARAVVDCRAAVSSARGCRFVVRRGVYRFATDRPLAFRGLANFTLDGGGSVWLFSRAKVFNALVSFEESRSVLVRDLQIDWDFARWRLASLVRIEDLWALSAESSRAGTGDQQIRMRFLDHPFLDLSTIRGIADMHKVDPETMTVGLPDPNRIGSFWRMDEILLRMEPQYDRAVGTNNTVVVTLLRGLWPAPTVGALYLVRHFTYEGHAVQIVRTRDVWMDMVSVWGAPGMALAARPGTADLRLTNFTVGALDNSTVEEMARIVEEPTPGAVRARLVPASDATRALRNSSTLEVVHLRVPALTRRISTAADAINIIGTDGHVHVEDAEAGFQGDDCSNSHETIVVGIERRGDSRLRLEDWQRGRIAVREGDLLEFRNQDFSPTGVFRTITGQPEWASNGWTVGLQGGALPMPAQGWTGPNGEVWWSSDDKIIVFNHRDNATKSVVYRRLHCHSNRSRGVLFQMERGGIEHSCFTGIEKRALSITADVRPGSWAEGTGIFDFFVRGCRFERCDKLDDGLGVVWSGAKGADWAPTSYPLLRGVRIEGNEFVEFPRTAVEIGAAGDAVVARNGFRNRRADGVGAAERGQVLVTRSSGVQVVGNEWSGIVPGQLIKVEGGATGVEARDNRVV
ncbi:hypothetical protein DFJ74DRAFT_771414 [Hyaloraphidium curvatum]|nr:hypothetical protein DFJ74DRAFT_771414 [Hyaloraphidium curvatum]